MQGGYHAQFDTMNVGEPYRASPAHFDTMNLGPGPQRVAQFDTVNLGAPVRVPDPSASAAHHVNAPPTGSTYDTTGETPMHPASSAMQTQTPKHDNVLYGRIPKILVIASANQGAPVRVSDPPASAAHHVTAPPTASTYATTGETPMHPTSAAMPTQTPKHDNVLYGRIPKNLVIASVALRAAAALSLIVALAIIASDSITVDHTIITYADSSAMK